MTHDQVPVAPTSASDDDWVRRRPRPGEMPGPPGASSGAAALTAHDPAHHDPDVHRLMSRTPSRVADRLSLLLDPPLVAALVLLASAVKGSSSVLHGVGWWLLAVLFVAVVPLSFLAWFVRTRRVADRHVVVRAQRHRLLLIAAVSALVGVLVLGEVHAPRPLWACEVSMLMGLALVALANTVVKASGHTGTMSGSASLLAMIWTPWTLVATVPMTAAIGWARHRAGRHSWRQILTGGGVGVLSSLLYWHLR